MYSIECKKVNIYPQLSTQAKARVFVSGLTKDFARSNNSAKSSDSIAKTS